MATVVQQVKLGFVVVVLVAAAFVAGTAGEEWCHYVVDMEIVRGREGRVKFDVSNSGVSGASWTQEKQVRADDSNIIRASLCVNGYYQFVTKNLCANPCHLSLKVVGQVGVLPASVRIRGYPSDSEGLNPAPKYDHLFTRRILDLLEADMDDC